MLDCTPVFHSSPYKVACHNIKFCLHCHLAICGGSVLGFEVAYFFICYGVWNSECSGVSPFFFLPS